MTEGARGFGPCAETAGDHIGDDLADILLLRRVIIGTGMITRRRESPASLLLFQVAQIAGRIINVGVRIEHLCNRAEMAAVIIMIDLHAADVDELGAAALGIVKALPCFR